MDTSKEIKIYIKMCDCPEIQRSWKPKTGDLFIRKGSDTLMYYLEQSEFGVIYNYVKEKRTIDYNWWTNSKIWLPRQEDLQEMIAEPIKYETSIMSLHLACIFARFCGIYDQDEEGSSNIYIHKGSLEMLWLAFVMSERYSKQWDGDKWGNR